MMMTTKTSTTPTTAVPAIRASCSRQLSFSGRETLVIKRSRRPLGLPPPPASRDKLCSLVNTPSCSVAGVGKVEETKGP